MAVNFFSDTIFNCDNFSITSASTGKPEVFITTNGNNTKPAILTFSKDKGAAGADDDGIGGISFVSDNDAQQQTTFGSISYSVASATDGQEEGRINIGVAALNSGGGNNSANVLQGIGNGQNVTDVTIGLGATNVTTIAGTLTMGSTATLDNSGNLLTNAATATALTSGNKTISGDLTTNNVFLPGGGTISFDDSLDGSDQFITGTDSNLTIDGDDKIKLRADTQIEIKSTSNADTVIITNNSGNIYTAGDIELGHASDTTISRSAAGKVTIEGNEIQTTNYHHHFLNAGFFLSFPFSRYIPLNGSINEQNTSTSSPEYTNFTWPYDGFVKKMILRTETDMGSTELKLYKGASGATVSTSMGAVTQTVDANNAVEFDFTSVTNTYSKGETMAVRVDPTDDPDGGQNITIELVFDLTT